MSSWQCEGVGFRLVDDEGRDVIPGEIGEMTITEISRETGTYVSNVNTSEQIVISGERMAVASALDLASARGAKKVIPLHVAGAFHSGLMEPATAGLVPLRRVGVPHQPSR